MLCKMEDEGASYGAALKGTVDRRFRAVSAVQSSDDYMVHSVLRELLSSH